METVNPTERPARSRAALVVAILCGLYLAALGGAAQALAREPVQPRGRLSDLAPGKPQATASLEQCLTSGTQSERSATFSGEMLAVPGTLRMQMSVQVLERLAGETDYHLVSAPGLGVWRFSEPGVQNYKYLRQVTNLAGPADYRAAIHFRWLGAHGRVIASLELRTRRCEEPTAPASSPPPADGTPVV